MNANIFGIVIINFLSTPNVSNIIKNIPIEISLKKRRQKVDPVRWYSAILKNGKNINMFNKIFIGI